MHAFLLTSRLVAGIAATVAISAPATVPLPNVSGNVMEEEFEPIEVTGLSKPLRYTAKQVTAAMKAYGKERVKLAPDAKVILTALPPSNGARLEGMKLRLVPLDKRKETIELEQDAYGRFLVPDFDYQKGDYDLMANRRAADVKIMLSVLSPGTSEADRRLGDLRLECAMGWALAKLEASPIFTGLISMAGGACNTKRVSIFLQSPRPIASVNVYNGVNVAPVTVGRTNRSYRPPVYEKKLPNSARVKFEFQK